MLDCRFRPLEGWPYPRTIGRRHLGGVQTFTALMDRLETELRALKAANITIETGHRREDIRNDGWPRSQARKPAHPGVALYFEARLLVNGKAMGPLRFTCDAYFEWQDNLRDIAMTLEDLRALERRKTIQGTEQYRGFAALPPPSEATPIAAPEPPRDARREAALCLLKWGDYEVTQANITGLLDDADLASRAFRAAVRRTNPDTTGLDGTAHREVIGAWEVLKP